MAVLRRPLVWLGLLAAFGAGAACRHAPVARPAAPFAGTPAVLCSASAAALNGDRAAAGSAFADVHADLHTLAAAVETSDRAAAARLLRAKQTVEADLAGGTGDLAPDLAALARVVADVQGLSAPKGCA
jgi:hypothetical protein